MLSVDVTADARAQKIAAAVQDLEALPGAVSTALQVMRKPRSSARDVAAVIERDQSLTAAVLRHANSAMIIGNRRIVSLGEAVFRIGFVEMRSILMAASTASVLERALVAYGLERGSLWRHSLATAILARNLARHLRLPEPEEAYVGGLLHDIGKVVLNKTIGRELAGPLQRALGEAGELDAAERRVLGFDHGYVGGLVIRHWGLPELLAEAIAYHHGPPDDAFLAALIGLADQLSVYLGAGNYPDEARPPLGAAELAFLGLVPADLDHVLESSRRALAGEADNRSDPPAVSVPPAEPVAAKPEPPAIVDAPSEVITARQRTGQKLVEFIVSIW